MHFFVDFIRSRIPSNWKRNSTGWISGNCPVCVQNGEPRPDRKHRGGFHIDENEWVYNCFNCKFKTGWSKGHKLTGKIKMLMKGFGVEEIELQRASLELLRDEEKNQLLKPQVIAPVSFKPQWKEIDLPSGAQPIDEVTTMTRQFISGVEMLNERNLTHWTDWYYTSTEFKFKRRIILPYRYKGAVVGYTSRYIGDAPPGIPKYIVNKPLGFVFNIDNQTVNRQFVIVTEGDFDAVTIDGVALGSNSMSTEQASLINQLNKQVILLPDADGAGIELIEPAIREGWTVSFPEWMDEFKDANQATEKYGRAFVLQSIISSAISNPTKIRVLAKRYRHK